MSPKLNKSFAEKIERLKTYKEMLKKSLEEFDDFGFEKCINDHNERYNKGETRRTPEWRKMITDLLSHKNLTDSAVDMVSNSPDPYLKIQLLTEQKNRAIVSEGLLMRLANDKSQLVSGMAIGCMSPETKEKYYNQRASLVGRSESLQKSGFLKKAAPQAKFPNLIENARPETGVKPLDYNSSTQMKAVYKKSPESSEVFDSMQNDGLSGKHNTAFVDEKGQAFASNKAHESTVAHEAHHQTTMKLINKYGIDKVHKLYGDMISKNVEPRLHNAIHDALRLSPHYKQQSESPNKEHQQIFNEEKVNFIRDLHSGHMRKDFGSFMATNGSKYGFKDPYDLDNAIKTSWKNIVNHAKLAKPEHLEQ
jgi:hypothetical protein